VIQSLRGGQRVLAEGPADTGPDYPRWSQNGRSIAYLNTGGLWVAQTDRPGRLLTRHASYPFAWAPDGRSIAFASGYPNDVVIADADGWTFRPLHLAAMGISSRRWSLITALGWSPDSRLLAVESTKSNKYKTRLWVIGRDGSGRRQVASAGDNHLAGWTGIAPARR
jgi:Tol biopolymer transport system component